MHLAGHVETLIMSFLCLQPRAISQRQEHCLEECWIQGCPPCSNLINQIKYERRPLGAIKIYTIMKTNCMALEWSQQNKDLIL